MRMEICAYVGMLAVASGADIDGIRERTIDREVARSEIVGTWRISTNSLSAIDEGMKQEDSWSVWGVPWTTISFHDNGTCVMRCESEKARNLSHMGNQAEEVIADLLSDGLVAGTWSVHDDILFFDRHARGLSIDMDMFSPGARHRLSYTLMLAEDHDGLVLWDTCGVGDSYSYQDFTRTGDAIHATPHARDDVVYHLNFRSSPIKLLLDFYSNMTGIRVEYDPHLDSLGERIDLQNEKGMTAEECVPAVEAALKASGFVFAHLEKDLVRVLPAP